jgi:ketosteroid isomerase-like protein
LFVNRKELVATLVELKFVKMSDMPQIRSRNGNENLKKRQEDTVKDSDEVEAEDDDGVVWVIDRESGASVREVKAVEYDYLFTMRISDLTFEKVGEMRRE